ncbi:MAG: FkbM family methyltransferase [Acidobacteria bacterium]|nr:MAG: FkbM family methyltransferase [Acidobacteriota bacterium]
MTVPNAKRSLAMKGLRRSYRHIKRFALALRGQELWQGVQHRVSKVSLGNEGACWCVSPEGISESSVVYSVGVGEDISFDLDLIQRYRLRVHAFDPTPRSIGWVQSQVLPEEFVFHSYGVAGFDGTCLFSPASDPAYVSHTLLPRSTPWPAVELPVYRLATIMKMLGNTAIDVLKMDIEGAEYEVLFDLLASGIRPRQILVEFHHRWPELGVGRTRRAVRELNQAGYWIFNVSASGEEYSFKLSY